jgi:hypothetical protein
VIFVGEGPGFNEDRQGRPFVGQAGALLSELLGTVGWSRPEVFITNVVKCRPPENRDPEPDEIAACAPFLTRQLAALDPAVASERLDDPAPAPARVEPSAAESPAEPAYSNAVAESAGLIAESESTNQLPLF